ncbi:MAG: hypothetical protein DMF95_19840 [Acidobacteria bacterium]|nr:MAG: hypothetical protein DMF95_19840 [Acidobacteriota bacterium]
MKGQRQRKGCRRERGLKEAQCKRASGWTNYFSGSAYVSEHSFRAGPRYSVADTGPSEAETAAAQVPVRQRVLRVVSDCPRRLPHAGQDRPRDITAGVLDRRRVDHCLLRRVSLGTQSPISRPEPDRAAASAIGLHDALHRLPGSGHTAGLHRILFRRVHVRHAPPQWREARRARLGLALFFCADVFGRYGGEEFVQICRHTTLAGAVADAERLRERIGALDVPVPHAIGRLTVSIGVAQYKPGETIMQTFARADGALHKAKQRGRDRVEC